MEELEALFSSKARPRILRLFLQNEEQSFNVKEIAKKCQLTQDSVKKELARLKKINLIQKKSFNKDNNQKKEKNFYILNQKFPLINELRSLLLDTPFFSQKELTSLFKKETGLQLVIITGIFLKENRSPVDLLIVSKKQKNSKILRLIKKIESQVGKEIRWSLMTIDEFNYRFGMNDRFLKDIFDHPHKNIIDKIGVH